jgi:hypothetical protein
VLAKIEPKETKILRDGCQKINHITYLKNWQKVKNTWGLDADEKEKKFIESKLKNCIKPLAKKASTYGF